MSERVAILGAGAWGTALAVHLARVSSASGIVLWARDPRQAQAIERARENVRYLPGVSLSPGISIASDLSSAAASASLIVVATPIAALPDLVDALRGVAAAPLLWVGKGFVADAKAAAGVALAHQVIAPRWPAPVGAISGPSFAVEVVRGLPTAVSVAATDAELAERAAHLLRGDAFRAYVSGDLTGVETGGAVKNVLAIAAGISDGLDFGHNARAALITRGLAETGRLSAALGGKRETLMGLAGLGDLVLTCTGDPSRNRRVGLGLARGAPLSRILAELGHVAEGVQAARAAHALAAALAIDMPICEAVYRVLHEDLAPRLAVESLLAREPGREFQ
ncbi:MAG TPA: NAD(P)H-dependent glycerol-3-phosphate dehydrogenase [Casimicrobiaceae bacterium]|nr:NAD(P)H-dependent glycerol-3-phosphate dehydrogenase [Casimicrobiaceae bacterium]